MAEVSFPIFFKYSSLVDPKTGIPRIANPIKTAPYLTNIESKQPMNNL